MVELGELKVVLKASPVTRPPSNPLSLGFDVSTFFKLMALTGSLGTHYPIKRKPKHVNVVTEAKSGRPSSCGIPFAYERGNDQGRFSRIRRGFAEEEKEKNRQKVQRSQRWVQQILTWLEWLMHHHISNS